MNSAWNSVTISRTLFYGTLAVLMVLLMNGCTGYFFYPMKELIHSPSDANIRYDDVTVTTRDNVDIHGWLLHADHPKGIVFFLHSSEDLKC